MATVLIVDDEPNIRRMVGALLTAEGHDVKEASTGSQALTRAAEDDPVLFIDREAVGVIANDVRIREELFLAGSFGSERRFARKNQLDEAPRRDRGSQRRRKSISQEFSA